MNNSTRVPNSVIYLIASAFQNVQYLEQNAKNIMQGNYRLGSVQDVHGIWHSARDFLQGTLRELHEIRNDGLNELRQRDIFVLGQIFDNVDLEFANDLTYYVDKLKAVAETFEDWIYRCANPNLRGAPNIYATRSLEMVNLSNELNFTRASLSTQFQKASPPYGYLTLCRGAVDLINRRDRGRVTPIRGSTHYISRTSSRRYVRDNGGGYRWWKCPSCAFRCEFYVAPGASATSTILDSDHIVTPRTISDMRYRATLSAMNHLPVEDVKDNDTLEKDTLGCAVCVAEGRHLSPGDNAFQRRGQLLNHLRARHSIHLPIDLITNRLGITVGPYAPIDTSFNVHFIR